MKYAFINEFDMASAPGKLLAQIKPGSTVLECGCATGYMTKYMKEKLNCSVYIVEYVQSGFDQAIQYATDGVCGDLMEDHWQKKFADIRFDYIMFADVLEHLRDPMQVLQAAKNLLKDEGVMLISLPNIGHNDIVAKLLNGRWDYTPTGLLDDTHIHFWGVNNLDAFFKEAGLLITVKDCVEQPTAGTEQYTNTPFSVNDQLYTLLKDRQEGEIYQFVLTVQKEAYVREQGVSCIEKLPKSPAASMQADSLQELKIKISNQQGHIELLLQIERELQHELTKIRNEYEQFRDKENRLQDELDTLRNSRSYRLGQAFAGVARFFIPIGSRRALCCRMLLTAIRHPLTFVRGLSGRRIKKFFGLLKQGEGEYAGRLIDNVLANTAESLLPITPPDIIPVDLSTQKTIKDYPVLQVPQWEDPKVSIVIPVYNQFEYTYHCVRSILKNTGDVTYEILIANDCSTDLTTEIDRILPGVRLITNAENLRFLRNCNNAAKHAKGEYILFLNNDTQVQPNWLQPLVSLIESADDIGMVGAKLIYPDGRLQEAGGILWRDGSAWNYGHGQNPAAPEFNYVKQVDYISGAAIMLSRALWEEIGGFDETFAPAYCEDSDLAFTVRKMGYRVMYQPLSTVVHFEGVSNGTDLASGQKAYQVVNQKKFLEKWTEELAKHPNNAEDVFHAREYSYKKKTLLMIDHYVPQFDKDAGSRTVFQYLKLFVKCGFNVKFIGDNFYRHEPYTTVLQQLGIEVLYGPDYAKNWKTWVKNNAEHIDYVFLNRPHIAPRYLDFLRENTHARIIYYGHDLAFLREMREFEITGDPSLKKSAENWQSRELDLMRRSDMAYYPSHVEVDEIHRIDPTIRVKAIPAYLFEDVDCVNYDLEDRKDIMFIGGFSHRPNVDAVKWLAQEILPELLGAHPDIKIHILGSNAPKEVLELANEHLVMEGFVTDEQLEEFYRTCRISLVPLRYGAGIKGKVIEAMRYGMPVVTTSIGAEGIVDAEQVMIVEDDGKKIAQEIARVYEDAKILAEMSRKGVAYIKKNFSPNNVIEVIGPDFGLC